MLKAEKLNKHYGDLQVLKEVSLEVSDGEMVCIVGPSGAGKSTLLGILGTLDRADTGKLLINGSDVLSLNDRAMSKFRNQNVGFVFQAHHLLPEFTALENICIPAFIAEKKSKREVEARALELLSMLGLKDRLSHKPSQLSGGEQQRVAVARALINSPAIVLADEPSGNLDTKNADGLNSLFLDLKKELKQTFVIVTHNDTLARLADRCIVMRDGQVVES